MPHLIVLDGYHSGTVVPAERFLVLGREGGADLRLADPLVSSQHATLRVGDDGAFEVVDLASTNGTYVNGERIKEPTRLELGDIVRLGSTHLLYTDRDSSAGTSTVHEGSLVHDSIVGEAPSEAPKVRYVRDLEDEVLLGDSGTSSQRGLKLALPVVDAVQRSFSVAWGLDDLIRRIALGFARATDAQGVAVLLQRGDEEEAEVALRARFDGEALGEAEPAGFEVDLALAEKALRERGAIVSELGPNADSTSVLDRSNLDNKTVVCLAFPSAARVVGGVYLFAPDTHLNRDDLRLLLLMANLAGVHLRSHLLLDRVRQQATALEQANLELQSAKDALATRSELLAGELDQATLRGRLLSRIVEHVQDAVVSTTLDGVVTSWNRGAEQLYGHETADVLGELLPTVPDDLGGELERILEAVSTGRSFEVRTSRITRDEVLVPVLATYAPVSDESGEVVGLVEIARDLRQRLRQEERLRYEARIATFSELAATLAHEIGNPLANLRSGVEWLLARPRGEEEQRESFEMLHAEIVRLHGLTREALDLARWRPPQAQPVSPCEIADYVAQATLQRAEQGGVELERIDGEGARELEVQVDSDQLKQALLNLVDNALEAMPAGGRLELEVDLREDAVVFGVRDTGVGLTPEARKRMFDPFFSTRPRGSGIGLAVVRRIAHLHGGELEVESEPNRGTRIALHVPIERSE